jgi:hypothetical protein
MKSFKSRFSYLDTKELVEYISVFDGFEDLNLLTSYETLKENIFENILKNYHDLKKNYVFSNDKKLQNDIEKFLYRLAIGNRKSYSVYKNDISHYRGKTIYKILFQNGIVEKEHSREELNFIYNKRRKRGYKGYRIEDKIKFKKGFDRFWFMFIYPYKKDLESGIFKNTLENIEENLDYFISLNFEYLSNKLLNKKFDIVEYGSYWDKFVEFDLYAVAKDGTTYIGECKWTNHKVNGSILNKLKKKCAKAGFDVDYYLLFSKSGFSNELLKSRDKDLILFDIEDFKGLFV